MDVIWFKISINDGTGFMKVVDGSCVGYFDADGQPIVAGEGTTVRVIENNVEGPANA